MCERSDAVADLTAAAEDLRLACESCFAGAGQALRSRFDGITRDPLPSDMTALLAAIGGPAGDHRPLHARNVPMFAELRPDV